MSLRSIPLSDIQHGQRVLLRIDGNFQRDEDGSIANGADWRLKRILPFIQDMVRRGAVVIICSHQRGQSPEDSLAPLGRWFKSVGNIPVAMASDVVGTHVQSLIDRADPGTCIVLENVRREAGEKENDERFARSLAALADIYINEAFGTCHRSHASIVGVTKFLPSFAGPSLLEEVYALSQPLTPPFDLVMGGVKLETKIPVMQQLAPRAERILVGGGIALALLSARDQRPLQLRGRVISESELQAAHEVLRLFSDKLLFPKDYLVEAEHGVKNRLSTDIDQTDVVVDIGEGTCRAFADALVGARTVIWNGTMGIAEREEASVGTATVADAIRTQDALTSIIGGGDTVGFLTKTNRLEGFSHISLGGGAMLAFLAKEPMPGLTVLTTEI